MLTIDKYYKTHKESDEIKELKEYIKRLCVALCKCEYDEDVENCSEDHWRTCGKCNKILLESNKEWGGCNSCGMPYCDNCLAHCCVSHCDDCGKCDDCDTEDDE